METSEPMSIVQDDKQVGINTHAASFLKGADEFLATEPITKEYIENQMFE